MGYSLASHGLLPEGRRSESPLPSLQRGAASASGVEVPESTDWHLVGTHTWPVHLLLLRNRVDGRHWDR